MFTRKLKDRQTNKQTNKPTKQKDYTSPALVGAGDYNKQNDRQTNETKRLYIASPSLVWELETSRKD